MPAGGDAPDRQEAFVGHPPQRSNRQPGEPGQVPDPDQAFRGFNRFVHTGSVAPAAYSASLRGSRIS